MNIHAEHLGARGLVRGHVDDAARAAPQLLVHRQVVERDARAHAQLVQVEVPHLGERENLLNLLTSNPKLPGPACSLAPRERGWGFNGV